MSLPLSPATSPAPPVKDYLKEVILLQHCSRLRAERVRDARCYAVLLSLQFKNGEQKICNYTLHLALQHFGVTLDEFCTSCNEEEIVLRYEVYLLLCDEQCAGLNLRQIASIFNVSKSTISRGITKRNALESLKIRRRKNWKLWLGERHELMLRQIKAFKREATSHTSNQIK